MSWYEISVWCVSSRAISISEPSSERPTAEQVFDQRSAEESDAGWGEFPADPAESDTRRLTKDQPPHHDRGW
jgi:hypothetical protein